MYIGHTVSMSPQGLGSNSLDPEGLKLERIDLA